MSMGNVYRRMGNHELALELDTVSLRIIKEYEKQLLKSGC